MPQVAAVKLRFNPKQLWFDPQGVTYQENTEVLVETERGREVGLIASGSIEVTDEDIKKLKSPLRPVVRELNDLDYEHLGVLEEKGRAAMPYFRELLAKYELDVKPVEVQYLFSGDRAVFFFSSEERVDFRDLVRDLAQYFHVRVDMRQIGSRDEAKEIGGIAHCGEVFCCARFGGGFQPVSIRMAKEQDLPLNPSKISGACGRLMCCLRYEYEAYKDFKKRAPKKGTPVDTPLGEAVISGYNTPREIMELKLEDGKRLNVPLAEMDCQKGKDGCTRCCVNTETIERCASRSMLLALGSLDFDASLEDAVATRSGAGRRSMAEQTTGERRGARNGERSAGRGGSGRGARGGTERDTERFGAGRDAERFDAECGAGEDDFSGERFDGRRRRRARTGGSTGEQTGQAAKTGAPAKDSARDSLRDSAGDSLRGSARVRQPFPDQGAEAAGEQGGRRKRNRNRTVEQGAEGAKAPQQSGGQQGGAHQNAAHQNGGERATESHDRPRPGQRSSGLRQHRGVVEGTGQGARVQKAPRDQHERYDQREGYEQRNRREQRGEQRASGEAQGQRGQREPRTPREQQGQQAAQGRHEPQTSQNHHEPQHGYREPQHGNQKSQQGNAASHERTDGRRRRPRTGGSTGGASDDGSKSQ